MNPYLLIYVWSKIRNIFQYLTLSETFNSVVHQALGSDGSRSELLLHRFTLRHIRHDSGHNSLQNFLSYSSFLIHFAGIRLIILWNKIELTLWENNPLISQHSQWQLAEEARRKGSPQWHFYVQKFLWWGSCCLQEKGEWPSVNAQNFVLSSLSTLQMNWNNGKRSFQTKFTGVLWSR